VREQISPNQRITLSPLMGLIRASVRELTVHKVNITPTALMLESIKRNFLGIDYTKRG